jgi:hypothetical protein
MSTTTVVYWRDIPVQVIEGQGRTAVRIALPDRFQQAIDRAATRAGLVGSDEYMNEWHKVTVEGDPEAVAEKLNADHPDEVLTELVSNGGRRAS